MLSIGTTLVQHEICDGVYPGLPESTPVLETWWRRAGSRLFTQAVLLQRYLMLGGIKVDVPGRIRRKTQGWVIRIWESSEEYLLRL